MSVVKLYEDKEVKELVITSDDVFLAEQAEAIRVLGKLMMADAVEIGSRLSGCHKLIVGDRGNRNLKPGEITWADWIKKEFGWTDNTATNFMNVYNMKASLIIDQAQMFLTLPITAGYLLARPTTLPEVRETAIEKLSHGETLSVSQVKTMISEAKDRQEAQKADNTAMELKRERDKATKKIEELQASFEEKEKEIRQEYDGLLTSEEVEAQVIQTIEPLKKKLDRANQELERLREPPKKPNKLGLANAAMTLSLRNFAESCTKITPEEVIEHQKFVTEATGQSLKVGLADKASDAKQAVAWLNKLVTLMGNEENE